MYFTPRRLPEKEGWLTRLRLQFRAKSFFKNTISIGLHNLSPFSLRRREGMRCAKRNSNKIQLQNFKHLHFFDGDRPSPAWRCD